MQTKLIQKLFSPFEIKFGLFFDDLERLFINEVIVNLYARTYKSGDVILQSGTPVPGVIFVMKGVIEICDQRPFCILGEGNYFGEFQVLKNIPCLFKLTAASNMAYKTKINKEQ